VFVAGTGLPDRCHENRCKERTAVRYVEVEEGGRAAGLANNPMFGSHKSVGHNTGLTEAAGWVTGRLQGCKPDRRVSCERQADYHILVDCIGSVIEETVKDYKEQDL